MKTDRHTLFIKNPHWYPEYVCTHSYYWNECNMGFCSHSRDAINWLELYEQTSMTLFCAAGWAAELMCGAVQWMHKRGSELHQKPLSEVRRPMEVERKRKSCRKTITSTYCQDALGCKKKNPQVILPQFLSHFLSFMAFFHKGLTSINST